jgi:hypothetical protein
MFNDPQDDPEPGPVASLVAKLWIALYVTCAAGSLGYALFLAR